MASGPGDVAQSPRTLSVSTVAWVLAGLIFIVPRLAAAFTMPVFGAEIDSLSGAWLASTGTGDRRYIPTLFQGITALLLTTDDSELWPRLAAVIASATVPIGFWLLRPRLGEIAAFVALLAVALNPVGIGLGASANASALDETVAIWVFVAFARGWWNPGSAFAAGLLCALCGPAPSLVLLAKLVTTKIALSTVPRSHLAAGSAGLVIGLLVASSRFGLGFDSFIVPPFDLLAAGSERNWSTASAGEVALLYQVPLFAGAVAALVAAIARRRPPRDALAMAWLGFAGGWWLFSTWQETPVPAGALGAPAAVVIAPALVRGIAAAFAVDRVFAAVGLSAAAVFLVLAGANVADWARVEDSGPAGEQALVALFLAAAAGSCAFIIYARASAVFVPVGAILGVVWLVAGAARIATGAADPLLSPVSPGLARDLRDAAIATRAETGGDIVVHPSLAEDAVWPFRDSGTLIVASLVPPSASYIIWPSDATAPEGFVPVEGDWALTRSIRTPTADTLDYLHWLLDRNTLAARPDRIAVYTRPGP